jgi:hypothetical protein
MKKDYTHISILLDRSGSMEDIKKDMIGGFNAFLKEQKTVPGQATLSLFKFDDKYDVVYEGLELAQVPEMDEHTLDPRGMTALYDSLKRAIDETGSWLLGIKEEDRPEKVLFYVITDGHENASRKVKVKDLKELIQKQQDTYNWVFVYLGANQDAMLSAANMGINISSNYMANGSGVSGMVCAMAANTTSYRAGQSMKWAKTYGEE